MPSFFIDRPIFAWVVAIFIMLAGIIAIPLLPVSQYPDVAPPQISINTSYPGASSQDTYQSVTRLIENELNGVEGLLYFESTSSAAGSVDISATFAPGTDPGQAAVDIQNRVRRVEPRLPDSVKRQGVQVDEAGSGFLMIVALTSTDGSMDAIGLGDYLSRNVLNEVQRVPGVGRAQLFATERSMRIWLDPDKMLGLNLTAGDVTNAIQRPERPDRIRLDRRTAEPDHAADQCSCCRQGSAVERRGIRSDRAARQSGRLLRASARRCPRRDRRRKLRVLDPPERQAVRGYRHAAVAERQRDVDLDGDQGAHGRTVEVLPGGPGIFGSLRHLALRRGFHREGAARRWSKRSALVFLRDVPVPAEHPLHASSRRSSCRSRCWAPAR